MTVAVVKAVAERFLRNERPEVLAFKGAWGVGKTHAWNQIILDNKAHTKFSKYCYVSLLGISSIAELRMSIFYKSQPILNLGEKIDFNKVNTEWKTVLPAKLAELTGAWGGLLNRLPLVKNIMIGVEAFAPHLIRDTIICLDDFERLSSSSISVDDVLGLISELKIEKNCKVVLIFNEQKLDDEIKNTYAKYREKIIDIELLYAPTSQEAAEIALPQNLNSLELVSKHCNLLNIRNIRVLRKIADFVELMQAELSNLHPQVMPQAVQTLVLVAWCYFELDEKKPSLKFLEKWDSFS
jgi:hypothetical protein